LENSFSLAGRNVIITGASSGIGKQCAITASNFGANCILISRNEERANETLKKLMPGNHLTIIHDLTDFQNTEKVISEAIEKIGKVSGLINAAGIQTTLPFQGSSPKVFHDLFSINVMASLELTRIAIRKKYFDDEGGSVIFISSIMGIVGNAGLTAYSASKGAIVSAVKSLALELSQRRIRVNSVSPGHIKTEMWEEIVHQLSETQVKSIEAKYPLGLGSPEDVANSCVFLLSDAGRWITGTNLVIDGGYTAQ
jgi:NAD(P)-dependent dehydrogenase (short-subunit alcohol dehydrogenase family)